MSVKDLQQKKFPCAKNVHKLMLLFWELWFLMREKWTQAIVYYGFIAEAAGKDPAGPAAGRFAERPGLVGRNSRFYRQTRETHAGSSWVACLKGSKHGGVRRPHVGVPAELAGGGVVQR